MRNPHRKHHTALAAMHAGLGVAAAFDAGPFAAPDLVMAGVYLHLAFWRTAAVRQRQGSARCWFTT